MARRGGAALRPPRRSRTPPSCARGSASRPCPRASTSAMGGYGGLGTRRAEGVLDPPEARALVLEQGELRVAIVSLDIVIARPNVRDARARGDRRRSASTCSRSSRRTRTRGPAATCPAGSPSALTAGDYDPESPARLAHAAAEARSSARSRDLAPARLASRNAPLALARNRRFADGASDDQLAVLRADFADGRTPIVLFDYGVHASVLSPRNHLLSADWPGAAREALAANGFRAHLLPGPLGDQEPDDRSAASGPASTRRARGDRGVRKRRWRSAVLVEAPSRSTRARRRALRARALGRAAARAVAPLLRAVVDEAAGEQLDRRSSSRSACRSRWCARANAEIADLPAEPGAASRRRDAHADRPRAHALRRRARERLARLRGRPETYERGGYEACFSIYGPGAWRTG